MTNQPEMTLEIDRYLDEACFFLKNSLMYQMSLGSKELFHSNVWGWLLENDKSFIKVFYPLNKIYYRSACSAAETVK